MNIQELKDILTMPIIDTPLKWNDETLEMVLEHCVETAARECLSKNKQRILMTLSGGLDSSFCLAIIRKIYPDSEIHTFTIGKCENFPDVKFARMVSNAFKTIHHESIPTRELLDRALQVKKERPELFPEEMGRPLGGIGVYLTYSMIADFQKPACVIAHDGIDELLGGYWGHRDPELNQETVFRLFWNQLWSAHLEPLLAKASSFQAEILFPYLHPRLVQFISRIPTWKRTSHEQSKVPLRRIAGKYIPPEIIERKKSGFGQAL